MNVNQLFDYFGGKSDPNGGGLYPGVEGRAATKNMLLDTLIGSDDVYMWIKSNDLDRVTLITSLAIDTLTDEQLIGLVMENNEGEPMEDLPPFIQEFSTNATYFTPPKADKAYGTLKRAVIYFANPSSDKKAFPEWLDARKEALTLRAVFVSLNRKR